MKTLQITDESLHNAHEKGCKEVKETLELLFPEEFEKKFDWNNFFFSPCLYITLRNQDEMILSNDLIEAFDKIGKPIFTGWWPHCTLDQLARLVNFLNDNRKRD